MEGGKDLWEYDGMLTPPPLADSALFCHPSSHCQDGGLFISSPPLDMSTP